MTAKLRMAVLPLAALLIACGSAPAAEGIRNGIANGGFEQGLAGWSSGGAFVEAVPGGPTGAFLRVRNEGSVRRDVDIAAGETRYAVAVEIGTRDIQAADGDGFAFGAVYQLDEAGEMVTFTDFARVRGTRERQREEFTVEVAPGVRTLSLRCGVFHATGEAVFDNWALVPGETVPPFDRLVEPTTRTRTARGVAGVFREAGFPAGPGAADPANLARILETAGAQVEYLSATELADSRALLPDRFDVVVLPYGDGFPAEARAAFLRYLAGGGSFISTGGYAFNTLYVNTPEGRVPETDWLAGRRADALAPPRGLIPDPGFEGEGLAAVAVGESDASGNWHRNGPGATITEGGSEAGRRCARVTAGPGAPEGEVKWDLRIPATPGRRLLITGQIRTEEVAGPGMAYMAAYVFGENEALLDWRDFAQVRGTTPWEPYEYEFTVPENARTIYVKCGLYRASGTALFDEIRLGDVTGLESRPMNTARGKPADGLDTLPEQIGVFDADFRLRRVGETRASDGQFIMPRDAATGPVTGWAASGVRGEDETRWIPLLTGFDRYGRERGAAGALLLHYAGRYAGSSWGFFGVESEDLFRDPDSPVSRGLGELFRFILRGTYLRNLESEFASYRAGESALVRVRAVNEGIREQRVRVSVFAHGGEGAEGVPVFAEDVVLPPGRTVPCSGEWTVPEGLSGAVRLRAVLEDAGGTVDDMEAGLAVLPREPSAGPGELTFAGNYLRLGGRPMFLFGSDNYGNVYTSSCEGPLWWDREHRASRDFGFRIYENLQYSNPDYRLTETDRRLFAGMAALTQQHRLVFMPCILVGHNVAISDELLAAQSRQCREYADLLGATPGLLWYINGDYQLRYDREGPLGDLWRSFLLERYGSGDAVRRAWGRPAAGDDGEIRFPPDAGSAWDDPVAMDKTRFNLWLMNRWNAAHVAAIRSSDGAHPITSEYYSFPFDGMDLRLTIGDQDISNIGFFEARGKDLEMLPLKLRWNDLRTRGKSLGLGEYGVKTHPAWHSRAGNQAYHGGRTEAEQKQLFEAAAHYGFAMGASRIQNWCLRDANQRVFPWGVFYPGPLVPKDVAYTHRNLALLFSAFAPEYEPPAATVLLCDDLRRGNGVPQALEAGYASFRALLGLQVDFNVLGDTFMESLPEETRVLLYPAASALPERVVDALEARVRGGLVLLVTGDVSKDEFRRPAPAGRLRRLAGVEPDDRAAEAGADDPGSAAARIRPAGAEVLERSADGTPVLTRFRLGEGTVYYSPQAVESGGEPGSVERLYRRVLAASGLNGLPFDPRDAPVHGFAQKTREGRVHIVVGVGGRAGTAEVGLETRAGPVTLAVRDGHSVLAAVSEGGAIRAIESHGKVAVGDAVLMTGDAHAAVLSLDGEDLRASRALLFLPFSAGTTTLFPGASADRRRAVVWGESRDGEFREVSEPMALVSGEIPLAVDADRATAFALICEDVFLNEARRLADRYIGRPESLPGY